MNILGLNYIFHDSSACLMQDGRILFAVEEERISRDKHTQKFPVNAIRACISNAGLTSSEIDHVAVSINPGKSEAAKLHHAAQLNGSSEKFLEYEFDRLRNRHLEFWSWYESEWGQRKNSKPEVHFINHHESHAVGSYHVSPWDEAALLSIDGWGEWSTTWMGCAKGRQITCFSESYFPNSLGVFYSAATEFCGFKPNYDEGKTMGLAPTGNPDTFYKFIDELVEVDEQGQIHIVSKWFDFPSLTGELCSLALIKELGLPRLPGEPFEQHHKDVAAAFQAVLENKILKIAGFLSKETGMENLVLSGGVALNSVANGRILKERIFKDIYLMPGAGDNGTCIGAAACTLAKVSPESACAHHDDPFTGTEFTSSEIEQTLAAAKIAYKKSPDICAEVAEILSQNKIVGWFQGRMEFGPRALGNRSILANPASTEMKDKINAEVKHREVFRPFAPSVLAERSREYFDINVDVPFMLKVCEVHPHMRSKIPAVVHVDGTARLQTVHQNTNPRYYSLISNLEKHTGHPVVLNTSFNVMGEPIVHTPEQALRCFFSTGIDVLAIGDYIIKK